MQPSVTIGLDVDEVLADLHGPWLAWGNKTFGTEYKEFTHWDAPTDWWGDKAYGFLHPDIYALKFIRPILGAQEAVALLRALGHQIRFVTSCFHSKPHEVAKRQWLRDFGMLYYDHEFIPGHDKSKVPVDVLVDDGWHNVQSFEGEYAVLVTRPHNRTEHALYRIDHVAELPGLLAFLYPNHSPAVENLHRENSSPRSG